jgi:CBS domain-containing protein
MTEKIARRGYHIYREYGVDPLERQHVDEVMSHSVETIDSELSVAEALETYFGRTQTHRAYPVVRQGMLAGVVDRTMLEKIRDNESGHTLDARLADVLHHHTAAFALPSETCRLVATRLAVHGLERLPVVADANTLQLIGIVSRSDLVKPSLAHFDDEHKKERFRRLRMPTGKRHFPPVP